MRLTKRKPFTLQNTTEGQKRTAGRYLKHCSYLASGNGNSSPHSNGKVKSMIGLSSHAAIRMILSQLSNVTVQSTLQSEQWLLRMSLVCASQHIDSLHLQFSQQELWQAFFSSSMATHNTNSGEWITGMGELSETNCSQDDSDWGSRQQKLKN